MTNYPCHSCNEDKPKYTLDNKGFPVCVDCAEGKQCPNPGCDNEGFTAEAYGNPNDPDWEQVQCEFCYTVKGSKFTLRESGKR